MAYVSLETYHKLYPPEPVRITTSDNLVLLLNLIGYDEIHNHDDLSL